MKLFMVFARRFRKFAARFRSVLIVNFMVEGWRTRRKFSARLQRSTIGATHRDFSLEQSVEYVDRVFSDYMQYSGLDRSSLRGTSILEIGPGDNLGVALRFLAAGASSVVCLDKFEAQNSQEQVSQINREILRKLPEDERRAGESIFLDPERLTIPIGTRLRYICGSSLEEGFHLFPPASFDLIVSRAVLEEITEPDRSFTAMDYLLAPAGQMVHRIDLSDYRMFSGNGFHPLEFLTLPESIYRVISREAGKPNRRRLTYYREMMRSLNYTFLLTPLRYLGNLDRTQSLSSLDLIKHRLAKPFRTLPNDDLIVSDFFLTAMKKSL